MQLLPTMSLYVCRTLTLIVLLLCCLGSTAKAGNLVKGDIERMVDYFYIVGEILPDIPVYPLFMRDAATPDAKPELKAYVFESIDFAPVRGYSAKPINLLILIDLSGNFLRIRLLDHKEPLFLDSAGTQKLERFASQYKGLSPRHTIEIGPFNDPGLRDETVAHVKGVQQGTISVKAINRAILTAAAAVATAKLKHGADDNVTAPVSAAIPKESKEAKDQKLTTASEESKTLNTSSKPVTEITEPRQDQNKDSSVSPVSPIAEKTNPGNAVNTAAMTGLSKGINDGSSASQTSVVDAQTSQPNSLKIDSQSTINSGPDLSNQSSERDDWISSWQSRSGHIMILLCGLVILSVLLIAQLRFSANHIRMRRLRTLYLVFTVGFIGWIAQGQLTIVNITAATEALSSQGDLSFMMNDPMTVILWLFTGVSLLVWGRGTFCGWLCPFGALQELISLVANALGHKQRRLRAALDTQLKWIKYVILIVLATSLYAAPSFAELLVEVEPFKTAISLYFVRDWPYVLWAMFCLLLSVFVYRGYCRYICPLGAALATLGILRFWSWIPRRDECGTPCQSCRHRCEYQAIAATGKIDYQECFQCLDCVAIYQDNERCYPLIKMKKIIPEVSRPR
jgi:hypothetical protein